MNAICDELPDAIAVFDAPTPVAGGGMAIPRWSIERVIVGAMTQIPWSYHAG